VSDGGQKYTKIVRKAKQTRNVKDRHRFLATSKEDVKRTTNIALMYVRVRSSIIHVQQKTRDIMLGLNITLRYDVFWDDECCVLRHFSNSVIVLRDYNGFEFFRKVRLSVSQIISYDT
jgi:hypothetical protein